MPDEKKRPLLYSVEEEQALLGSLLTNNAALRMCSDLRAEHFYEPIHQRIFESIAVLVEAGKPANPLTVRQMLPADLNVAGLSANQYLARLCAEATTVINAPDYARDISQFHRARERDLAHSQMLADLAEGATLEEAAARFDSAIDAIRVGQATAKQTIVSIEVSARRFVEKAMEIQSGTVAAATKTGLHDLDNVTGGIHGGELVIVAGRPGSGKSTLVSSLCRQVAKRGAGVAFFSLEMPEGQATPRFLADEAYDDGAFDWDGKPKVRLEYERLARRAELSQAEIDRMLDAEKRFAWLPIEIDFSSRLTMGEIAVRSRGIQAVMETRYKKPLKLIAIDYVRQVQASDRYRGLRVYEIGEITGACKELAKDTDTTVILAAQLSRAVESTEDKRPQLHHLKESGELEENADVALLLYREGYYLKMDPTFSMVGSEASRRYAECANELEVNVAKNRMGRTTWIKLFCDIGCSAVRSMGYGAPQEHPADLLTLNG
jgi:replicative DNA helicase